MGCRDKKIDIVSTILPYNWSKKMTSQSNRRSCKMCALLLICAILAICYLVFVVVCSNHPDSFVTLNSLKNESDVDKFLRLELIPQSTNIQQVQDYVVQHNLDCGDVIEAGSYLRNRYPSVGFDAVLICNVELTSEFYTNLDGILACLNGVVTNGNLAIRFVFQDRLLQDIFLEVGTAGF